MPTCRTVLPLLLPLLAAGCAAATATTSPATRVGDAAAPEVRFARVSSRSLVVQLERSAHAAILEVRPDAIHVVRWLGGREVQALPAGAHTVSLGGPNQPVRHPVCGSGEKLFYDRRTAAAAVGVERVREEWTSDGYGPFFCALVERNVLVVVSPLPVEHGRLEELVSAFNVRYAGLSVDAETLSRTLAEMLASAWAGSAGYSLYVPG